MKKGIYIIPLVIILISSQKYPVTNRNESSEGLQARGAYNLRQSAQTGLCQIIYDLNFLEEKAGVEECPFFKGIAIVMRAYWYQDVVDMFGDPGNLLSSSQAPVLDDIQTIYADLLKKIDVGIALIKTAGLFLHGEEQYDVLWHGEKAKWVKLANTIKLQLLIRRSGNKNSSAQTRLEISRISSDGIGFLEEELLINPGYHSAGGRFNPIYTTYGLAEDGVAGADVAYPSMRPGNNEENVLSTEFRFLLNRTLKVMSKTIVKI